MVVLYLSALFPGVRPTVLDPGNPPKPAPAPGAYGSVQRPRDVFYRHGCRGLLVAPHAWNQGCCQTCHDAQDSPPQRRIVQLKMSTPSRLRRPGPDRPPRQPRSPPWAFKELLWLVPFVLGDEILRNTGLGSTYKVAVTPGANTASSVSRDKPPHSLFDRTLTLYSQAASQAPRAVAESQPEPCGLPRSTVRESLLGQITEFAKCGVTDPSRPRGRPPRHAVGFALSPILWDISSMA